MDLPPTLLGITTFVLHRVAVTSRSAVAERMARDAGLGLWQFAVLAAVADTGPAAQREIGDSLGLDPSDLARLMDELLTADLVARERDTADRRRYRVTLTTTGRAALRRAKAVVAKVEQETLAPLTETERKRLHALVGKIHRAR
ncbi:MarR family winged helix-turn-helix transcriptional regulator [Allokutzneria oryzae]|uniref:MarR family winged helix-turn-helix transcriptional regulator n=1 Tax=Allokutzneria oryzae TaxID=1378989 RepID=A0ABV6A5W7_9PSEU